MKKILFFSTLIVSLLLSIRPVLAAPDTNKPLFRDFMGLCVHTVQFKPDLYKPICRLVRDYHDLRWDLGDDTDFWPSFPFARNRVNWQTMYRSWTEAGFEINASLMFNQIPPERWVNLPRDAHTYGFAFARFFGPGHHNLVTAAEIGNEPGAYDDPNFIRLFENLARGLRAGDPRLKIATCAVVDGPSHKYAKSLDCFRRLKHLYDVINLHTYAQIEGWPTWRRSYPEDPNLDYLKKIRQIIAWRNQNALGKEIWITEFGYDACTKPAPDSGDFKDWVGSTETEQARYLVRSFLVFSALDIDRAYIFWFNDTDEPHVHGSSGLTRNYTPKPAYHAVAFLYQTLADYRLHRIVAQTPDLYTYEFHPADPADGPIWVAWSPSGDDRTSDHTLPLPASRVKQALRLPLSADPPQSVPYSEISPASIKLPISPAPTFLFLKNP